MLCAVLDRPTANLAARRPACNGSRLATPLLTPGAGTYWKSGNFAELADGAFDAMLEFAGSLPKNLPPLAAREKKGRSRQHFPQQSKHPSLRPAGR
jgi:hypothetical protein